jgi:hypothetical protein
MIDECGAVAKRELVGETEELRQKARSSGTFSAINRT